ncbi:hypothetical protein RBU61_02945 [Tissierella sp. MB52-C2]|uniref:hypothetical protein n=1 Tax=Tissierella sp. MB52-C2 TaxID=3070999 RepID=UPI00280AF2EE|nr:hypothetical protein [Tissierella sp. MB52-C2]WMM25641.1 hypothetical protein RBU61_02945 [Tissierella sp. MB52-C2]
MSQRKILDKDMEITGKVVNYLMKVEELTFEKIKTILNYTSIAMSIYDAILKKHANKLDE